MMTISRHLLATALLVALPLSAQRYDPLALPAAKLAPPIDLTIRDAARQRDIPIRVFLPTTTAAAPVVLFSSRSRRLPRERRLPRRPLGRARLRDGRDAAHRQR
ncbi:MAG: hypothetical protein V9E87_01090 [Gemmatimonadales bacterium]